MTIERMTESHVAAVAALEKLCFADPWSLSSIASELNNPLALWLVAVEDGDLIGYIGSQSVMGESDMMNVAVHPDHRRKGLGERLVLALCEALSGENTSLALEVRSSNAPAISLYEKLGFVLIGNRKNFYSGPRENALIYKREQ